MCSVGTCTLLVHSQLGSKKWLSHNQRLQANMNILLLRRKIHEYFMPIFLLAWLLENKSRNFISCYVFSCKIFRSNYVRTANSIAPFVQIETSLQVTTCYRICLIYMEVQQIYSARGRNQCWRLDSHLQIQSIMTLVLREKPDSGL